MSDLFLKLFNMSITASWLVLVVVLLRYILQKASKWMNCVLWGMVAFRLTCPFSFKSVFSLIPSKETVNSSVYISRPYIQSGITLLDNIANDYLGSHYFEGITVPVKGNVSNPINILGMLWMIGMAVLLLFAFISYFRFKNKVRASVCLYDNIYACDEVKSPFILGVFKPVIYVPSGISSKTMEYIVTHEKAHIKRYDHIWKMMGYLLLVVYWFNPLIWLAYILFCRDIEFACDEKVIKDFDKESKAAYSQALLDCSFPHKMIITCPLAFGDVGVKERVKRVLYYRKPVFGVIIIAIIACVVTAVCFLTNPLSNNVIKNKLAEGDYRIDKVIYDCPMFSYLYEPDNSPAYRVTSNEELWIYNTTVWENTGKLYEIKLTKENFDALFIGAEGDAGWIDGMTSSKIRNNNLAAWCADDTDGKSYYLLQQKNGTRYVVCMEMQDLIRRVFLIKEAM